ncbi:mercuric ion binding protein [Constrictibacter sp. MBR-5]|uniref:heavy-metal-associated domain-containing protein n=1 Tax=Constrictibacter sp. MBR-5 TaxID=3156467 RepID=UPI0033921BA5
MNRPLMLPAALLAVGGFGAVGLTVLPSLSAPPAAAQVAAVQSATFTVENMTCALCPVTVKKAIENVTGVQSVQIDYAARTATAIFDPAVTSVEAIAAASTDAGYPAAIKR